MMNRAIRRISNTLYLFSGKIFCAFFILAAQLGFGNIVSDAPVQSSADSIITNTLNSEFSGIYIKEGSFIYKSGGAVLVYAKPVTVKKSSKARPDKKHITAVQPKKNITKKRTRSEETPNVFVLNPTPGTDSISASTALGKSVIIPVNKRVLNYINQNLPYNIAVLICCILIVIDFCKKGYVSFLFEGQLFQRPPPSPLKRGVAKI